MSREVHDFIQGSDAWHQFRLDHFGASEAAAMLGLSKKVSRTELLHAKHTGIAREYSDWFQVNIFDYGHAVEAHARPLVEEMIGDELYPATYSFGKLSASCDGLTMDGTIAFEHKQWNEALADAVERGELPEEHQPQCQQVMYVTGASKLIFVVSNGTKEKMVFMEVHPDEAWVSKIKAGWQQFVIDLASFQPAEVIPAVTGAPIKSLPALMVQLVGEVKSSNLVLYRETALKFIQSINTDLQTDQDFADAEKTVKFCDAAEKELDTVKKQALSQTASIDELFRTVDMLKEEMRSKRLELDKLVKARKEAIRIEIVQGGKDALAEHLAGLDKRLGKPYLPVIQADFAGVMKGKKSIASLRDAVDTELARVKIEANAIADRIQINMNSLRELAKDHAFLFADTAQIVLKQNDDLVTLIKMRVREHDAAEKQRLDDERERIRREEEAKAAAQAAEAAAKLAREQAQQAAGPTSITDVLHAAAPAALAQALYPTQGKATNTSQQVASFTPTANVRPTDDEIIEALSMRFQVSDSTVIDWLGTVDLVAARDSRPVYAGTLRVGARK